MIMFSTARCSSCLAAIALLPYECLAGLHLTGKAAYHSNSIGILLRKLQSPCTTNNRVALRTVGTKNAVEYLGPVTSKAVHISYLSCRQKLDIAYCLNSLRQLGEGVWKFPLIREWVAQVIKGQVDFQEGFIPLHGVSSGVFVLDGIFVSGFKNFMKFLSCPFLPPFVSDHIFSQ
jgi:hypothetical protein